MSLSIWKPMNYSPRYRLAYKPMPVNIPANTMLTTQATRAFTPPLPPLERVRDEADYYILVTIPPSVASINCTRLRISGPSGTCSFT